MEAADQSRCILFRLPREIRHKVYGCVASLDVEPHLPARYAGKYMADCGFVRMLDTQPGAQLSIPWVQLRLTCRAMNTELSEYLDSAAFLRPEENRTMVVDVVAGRGSLVQAALRRIPCQPAKVDTLVADLDMRIENIKFRGCGGPMNIVRDLYQTLNWILHYGPHFSRTSPLGQPLRLKSLVIRASTGEKFDGNRCRDCKFNRIADLLATLQTTGLLWGYVERIRLSDEFGHERIIVVTPDEDPGVPRAWDRYGFQWGLDAKHIAPSEFASGSCERQVKAAGVLLK